jgi:hypothetical protein
LTGFGELELEKLLLGADDDDGDPDEAPAPPAEPISRPGDLWICGEHRVLCGDATVRADVEKLLDGELADMAFTDPPYNVNYANSAKDKLRGKNRPILNDALGDGFGALLQAASANVLAVYQGRRLHLHVVIGTRHTAEGVPRGRRQVVDLRDLGQKHVHARPRRLPTAVRAHSLWLEGRHRPLLVRRARSRGCLVVRQAPQERSAPDYEAGGAGRTRDP